MVSGRITDRIKVYLPFVKAPKSRKPFGSDEQQLIKVEKGGFALERINFYIMIGAAVAIIIGFLLMLGGSSDAESFNPDIFSTRRIIVGPTIAFLGFVAMAVGIMYRGRRHKSDSGNADKESSEK